MSDALRQAVEGIRSRSREEALPVIGDLLDALEAGEVRAAVPDPDSPSGWRAEGWVKEGILAAFAFATEVDVKLSPFAYRDRDLLMPLANLPAGARVVPGGSAIRRGVHLGDRVVVMPPAYVNVGAYVDERSMIDSHSLVGSCAQIGREVHLSAAAQVGGVLEPAGALPVIVEDEVFVGGNAGLYEGVVVKTRAVLAAGVVLTGSSRIYDLVQETVHRAGRGEPLVVPEGAVVVMGTRPASGRFASEHGVALQTPVIVKYRDASTDAKTALEDTLR